jgi:DNA polymerase III subunit epsilon
LITILDFEATSRFANEAWPTEIALVKLDWNLNQIETFQTLIKPPQGAVIDSAALTISRLTHEEINSAEYFDRYWTEIAPIISESVVVAHNATYDISILQKCLLQMNIEELPPNACTLQMSRKALRNIVPNFKLGTLCSHFGIPLNGHRALDDALATADLLRRLIEINPHFILELKQKQSTSEKFEITGRHRELSKVPTPRSASSDSNNSDEIDPGVLIAIRTSSKTQIVLTGTPSYGKDVFARRAERIGLRYQETSPGGKTIFVVKAPDFGQRKINMALEKGIPILTQAQFDWLVENQSI